MYGGGSGIGPIASGGGGAVLAYTGTGSFTLPLVVASVCFAAGVLLFVRGRLIARAASVA